jgi:hypothetical protein
MTAWVSRRIPAIMKYLWGSFSTSRNGVREYRHQ